ncbi:MAG: hypothetical protein QNJ97_05940 [Myxococcota bacterium]|nr:hypothetical protein [Myxococcota bacterium]
MTTLVKKSVSITLLIVGLISAGLAEAHLPAYEGERVRNDNHFTTGGFAAPVRGECDFFANGPTDPSLGSANIYLGGANVPPNFFCLFTSQDDWSFGQPLEIIESARTPSPDPRTLGLPLEEGYIPCSPINPDPFQCPRQIVNPQNPGQPIQLPGECVDLGQPDDPAASPEPDGEYHCALLPGAPRPRTSSVAFSTLTGPDDVDWAVYRYDPVFAETPIVGAPQVPACRQTLNSFVTFAYAGPLGMLDARSDEPLFVPLDEAGPLPEEVEDNLPLGYGVRVSRPSSYRPSWHDPRLGYASGYGQNGWLLAEDSVVECIDNFEKCLADETGELKKHYNYNDIFFIKEDSHVDLYLMWWVDDRRPGGFWDRWVRPRQLTDVSITTGVIDQFIVGDFASIGVTGPFSANGRYIHGRCTDPRPSGRAEIVIETNQ